MIGFVIVLWRQRSYMTPFGGIFPDRVMIIILVLAVMTILFSFSGRIGVQEKQNGDNEPVRRNVFQLFAVGIALLAWASLLRYLGFALSGIIGFSGISWYLGSPRGNVRIIISSIVTGVAMTYLLIYVFGHLLLVPLPQGTIFD